MKTQVQSSAALSANEKLALAQLLQEQPSVDESIPLSYAQQRLWFLDQLQPKSPLYNVPTAIRISGFLNLQALKNSLEAIVGRHEVLRTIYATENGNPVQRITNRFCLEMPLYDLSDVPETRRTEELNDRLREAAQQPFDLAKDLMIRAALFRLDIKEHVLFLNVHHIAFDEWSQRILFSELLLLYQAFCEKKPSPLRELPIQYADYALWQRETLQGAAYREQLNFWKEHLGTNPMPLELSGDLPRPTTATSRGAREQRAFSRGLEQSLRAMCRKEGVTLYMVLLAAFKTLLHRYTQQEDIIVGTPVAGRGRIETEELVGFFVNTLALRTNFGGNPTFRELLRREREICLSCFSQQDFPFDKVVQEIQPERTSAHSPIFNVVFSLQSGIHNKLETPGLTFTPVDIDNGTAKFDLTLAMQETSDGLNAVLEYNSDMFSAAAASRMLGHLECLLEAIIANPEQKISQLPILTASERHQILIEWNRTMTDYPRKATVQDLFEAQAERTPNAIAVTYGNNKLTYRELNDRANQLANFLRRLGARTDVLIGISVDRSVEMIVGWLGILKAGAAYVPLDPEYPKERLAFMIEDTRMPVLLTQKKYLNQLPARNAITVCLDSDWRAISRESKIAPVTGTTAENLAYVIYTSGSTGKPKGAAVPHRGILRLIFNTNYIQLNTDDRIPQISNSSFDAATFEVWGSLLHGGCLVGLEKNVFLSPTDFTNFLREERISAMFLTVALFNQTAAVVPDAFRTLRDVLFGGEAADAQTVREVLRKGPPSRLLNVYGPTESTTFSSGYEIKELSDTAKSVPIGRPISNTTYYILDRNLQPLPVGVPGELYIGGDGLAHGYFNRPELTQARFIPNPFSTTGNSRLYKTGDLVRWLPDGNVEFLGRIDSQVKIRGFRIEPEEIEAVLKQHGSARDATVLVRQDVPGDKCLVAYVVPKANQTVTSDDLRSFLKQTLPDYMIPSAFVVMESFPLTPNGKIDRRLLPKPEVTTNAEHLANGPRGHLENQLIRIWEQVLDRRPISVRDNFFDLGGHSLMAVKLFSQIERTLGPKLPLQILFEAPTIEQLAQVIREKGWSPAGSSLVEIKAEGSRPPIFWLHTLGGGGGGGLFTYHKLAQLLGPEQPSHGFMAPHEPHASIEEMASHYIDELRVIQPQGPYSLGGYCFGGIVAYEMARQLVGRGEEVSMVALIESMPLRVGCEPQRLNAQSITHFLKNVPLWLWTVCRQPDEMMRRISIKAKLLKRRLSGKVADNAFREADSLIAIELEDVIDMSQYPKDFKRFAESHWGALLRYSPKPFHGRVALFRTRQPRLFTPEPEVSWKKLATDGVDVHIIPGTHESILHEPYVQSLARELSDYIERINRERKPAV